MESATHTLENEVLFVWNTRYTCAFDIQVCYLLQKTNESEIILTDNFQTIKKYHYYSKILQSLMRCLYIHKISVTLQPLVKVRVGPTLAPAPE